MVAAALLVPSTDAAASMIKKKKNKKAQTETVAAPAPAPKKKQTPYQKLMKEVVDDVLVQRIGDHDPTIGIAGVIQHFPGFFGQIRKVAAV